MDIVDEPLALELIKSSWSARRRLQIITLNAEMVVAAQQDRELDRIIRHADLIIPDGAGVVWALKLTGHKVQRLAGIDLASATLSQAASCGSKVALIGAKAEVLEQAVVLLAKTHPGLNIVAYHHGYFSAADEEKVVSQVALAQPDLVLVAMGVPRQEYFIDRWQAAFSQCVVIGVGGSFDIWAGVSKRAPIVMRRLHLEWLYRMVSEPWRLKRIGSSLPNFGWQVVFESIFRGRGSETKAKNPDDKSV